MTGWVYVITNKAMPNLLKVGFTMKKPAQRAAELNHTGSPHQYQVDYEILVDEPYKVEQATHELLASKHEAKEWFRCSLDDAIAAIKKAAESRILKERHTRAERASAEELRQQELRELETKRKRRLAEQQIEMRLNKEESAIRAKHQQLIDQLLPERPFWHYWLANSALVAIGMPMAFPKASAGGIFFLSALSGSILGVFSKSHFKNRRKQSSEYCALDKRRETELRDVRSKFTSCPKCRKTVRFDRAKLLNFETQLAWKCPACKQALLPPMA